MELWVRTQSRFELAKINSVYAGYQEKDKDYVIMGEKHNGGARLGSYATKERALEVLNEIQEFIEKRGENYLLTNKDGIITGQKHYGLVYEMPEQ